MSKEEKETCDDPRIKALAQLEGIDPEEIEDNGDNEYVIGGARRGKSYFVLTDKEADEKVKEIIADELWAFKPDFIEDVTGVRGLSGLLKASEDKCESLNDPVRDIVNSTCGIDKFVEEAVSADGRGHFLSQYDGEEHEVEVCGETYYIFRTN